MDAPGTAAVSGVHLVRSEHNRHRVEVAWSLDSPLYGDLDELFLYNDQQPGVSPQSTGPIVAKEA